MSNWWLESVLRGLRKLRKAEKDPTKREFIKTLIDNQESGIDLTNRQIYAAKMIGVRNPAYDGDYIGYPEDDFENAEKTDDDEDSK